MDYSLEHFFDANRKFFIYTSDLDSALISKKYEIEDNVIPASNSIMARNLHQLSVHFGNNFYEKTAQEMLDQILANIDYPSAFSNWLNLALDFTNAKELAIVGPNALSELYKLNSHYLPNILISGSTENSTLPFLSNRFQKEKTLFYLCENRTCLAPTENYEELIKSIL